MWLTVRANGWKCHSVEGGNAATLHLAKVNIVLDCASKKFGLVESVGVKTGSRGESCSAVVWAVDFVSGGGALRREVEGLLLSVLFDLDGSEAILLGSGFVWVEELLLTERGSAEASKTECRFHFRYQT